MQTRPKIAIVEQNTLAAIGLKSLLQNVMPVMEIDTFGSLAELENGEPDGYAHYFVAANVVIDNREYFAERCRKTIVLTTSPEVWPAGFHSICVSVPEHELVHTLLTLQQGAHPKGKNLPPMPEILDQKILSDREIEVMSLIVRGYINKEIADQLNIGLSTVITHRRNIMEKLGMKSVSALTIYAVTHGYVDISKI